MNKKAGSLSVIMWLASVLVVIFFLAGFVYFSHTLTNALMNTKLDTVIVNITDATSKTLLQVDNAMTNLNWISFILLVTLGFAILLENFYIRQHPVLLFVHILIVILGIVGAIYISNYYETLASTGPLASTIQSEFTLTYYIADYLPVWVAVLGIFGFILLVINANRDPEIKFRGGI